MESQAQINSEIAAHWLVKGKPGPKPKPKPPPDPNKKERRKPGSEAVSIKCSHCDLTFPYMSKMLEHKVKHEDDYSYECGQCDKVFKTLKNLKSHFYSLHVKDVLAEKKMSSVGQQEIPISDTSSVNDDRPPVSPDGDSSSDVEEQETSEVVSGVPYQCEYCGKACASNAGLDVHLRVHTNERPFQCTTCAKSYKTAYELKVHVRTHTNEKPFKCPDCGKAFSIQRSMLDHQRRHNNAFRYFCEVLGCGKGFVTKQDRDRHEVRGHVPVDQRPVDQKVQCPVCGKALAHKGVLSEHLRTHSEETPFQCQLCGKGFKQAGHLRVHLKSKKHTGEEKKKRRGLGKKQVAELECDSDCNIGANETERIVKQPTSSQFTHEDVKMQMQQSNHHMPALEVARPQCNSLYREQYHQPNLPLPLSMPTLTLHDAAFHSFS